MSHDFLKLEVAAYNQTSLNVPSSTKADTDAKHKVSLVYSNSIGHDYVSSHNLTQLDKH